MAEVPKVQNFSYELLKHMFSYLERNDVYQCMFVVKSWKKAATHNYLQDVVLSATGVSALKSQDYTIK